MEINNKLAITVVWHNSGVAGFESLSVVGWFTKIN